jgi:hypothetical protein
VTENANGGRGPDSRPREVTLTTVAALAAVLVGLLLILFMRPFEPQPQPSASLPGLPPPVSASPSAISPVPTATAPPSPPSGVEGQVGDYGCLRLPDATAAIERDGFVLGTVAYTIEGGPVADDWLVSDQTPGPGTDAAPGSAVNLVISSPFFVCPSR